MEIERKFLVKTPPADLLNYPSKYIEQAYIAFSPAIRIRRMDDTYYLTVKTGGGLIKEEFETQISYDQYESLCKKTEARFIKKTRYYIPLPDGLTAEYDVYYDFLEGLSTVEVEFDSTDQAETFTPPGWFGADVTDNRAYANSSMAVYGKPV